MKDLKSVERRSKLFICFRGTPIISLELYKSRDASEKLFSGDKSYLGNKSLRVQSDEAAAGKIFTEFIALIVRCRMYTLLKEELEQLEPKPNYMTVPAAIRELEKIEMVREAEGHAESIRLHKEAEAEGINMIKQAEADGIRKLLEAGMNQEQIVQLRSLETLATASNGQATKIIIPSDIQNIAGLATSVKELVK